MLLSSMPQEGNGVALEFSSQETVSTTTNILADLLSAAAQDELLRSTSFAFSFVCFAGLQSVSLLRSENPVLLKTPISKGNNVASNKLEKEAARLAERRKEIVATAIKAGAVCHKERCKNLKLEFENDLKRDQKCLSKASKAPD